MEYQSKKIGGFPFGGFKTPEVSKKGHYSGAERDFQKELQYDEGDSDDFRANLKRLQDEEARIEFERCWNEVINRNKKDYETLPLEVYLIGQSHMDIAWLWRMYQIVNKAKITFGKAAFHALNLPDYQFVFSQPLMLDWLRYVHPTIFEDIKKAIKTGKFEIQGGMWIECDGKVPNGESFCRQRLYGQKFYLDHFGKLAEIEWLPDSFGYNNNIPQFTRKSGGKYFHTQKIVGNHFVAGATFPYTHFIWRSLDNSEVACYSTNFQYRPLVRWKMYEKTRRILKPGESLVADYETKDIENSPAWGEVHPEVLILFGVGDGGHGPRSEEVHRARYLIEQGKVKGWTSAIDYFRKYDSIYDRLPIWNKAELYYNLHRGTLSTQGLMKRMNRYFEWNINALQSIFTRLLFEAGTDNPNSMELQLDEELYSYQEIFERLWKDCLVLQFHDILPGSSIPEVYDDCYDIWSINKPALSKLRNIFLEKLKIAYNISDTSFVVVNPTDFHGTAPIEIPLEKFLQRSEILGGKRFYLEDEKGIYYPLQQKTQFEIEEPLISQHQAVTAVIPYLSWGYQSFRLVSEDSNPSNFAQVEKQLELVENENEVEIRSTFSTIRFNQFGDIIYYEDKQDQENTKIIINQKSNKFALFTDWSMTEPAWNIGPGYREMPFDDDEVEQLPLTIEANGPVFISLLRTIKLIESETVVSQRIMIYRDLPGIYFEVYSDWHQENVILKNEFFFNFQSKYVFAEGPYTTEKYISDPATRTKLDAQRWESACHTYVNIPSEIGGGVTYINDSKYGFDVDCNRIGITLLRGPEYPNASGYAAEERKNQPDPPPTHADQEEHFMKYAFIPYNGEWAANDMSKRAHQFNSEPIMNGSLSTENYEKNLKSSEIPIRISSMNGKESPNLEITALKFGEFSHQQSNDIFLRIVETGRLETEAQIDIPQKMGNIQTKDVWLCDLLERPIEKLSIVEKDNTKRVKVKWNPHEIHTLKIGGVI